MLDLEAGVHLEEVELAVLVEELDGAGVDVVAAVGDLDRGLAHRLATDLVGEAGRRALLDQLLVAALRRAVALAEPHAVAVRVGDHLHLDVAGLGEVALHVALVRPKYDVASRWADSNGRRPRRRRATTFMPAAAAAVGGLDRDRPAVLVAEGDDLAGS